MADALSFDIAIVGGGQVGLLAALTFAQHCSDLSICLIEGREFGVSGDPRATALSPGAINMLDRLGCWDALKDQAGIIDEMRITDSALQDRIRPQFLWFNGAGQDDTPIAHMVDNRLLISTLANQLASKNVTIFEQTRVTGWDAQTGGLDVVPLDGEDFTIEPKLILACDGAKSRLREWAGIKNFTYEYDQMGLVATIQHEWPHKNIAFEHFLPAGPFATLPLKESEEGKHRSSIVWSVDKQSADALLKAESKDQVEALNQTMGPYLGKANFETKLQGFGLGLSLAKEYYKDNIILVGDAAHKIHPLAGQGLNMGFADVAALYDALYEVRRLGLASNDQTMFENYQKARRFVGWRMAMTTDVLNRLFSNESEMLKIARDIGMGMLNQFDGVKAQLIKEASGADKNAASLMRNY